MRPLFISFTNSLDNVPKNCQKTSQRPLLLVTPDTIVYRTPNYNQCFWFPSQHISQLSDPSQNLTSISRAFRSKLTSFGWNFCEFNVIPGVIFLIVQTRVANTPTNHQRHIHNFNTFYTLFAVASNLIHLVRLMRWLKISEEITTFWPFADLKIADWTLSLWS